MKELSINEKAKAYDEAIERAKKIYGNGIIERIFPELKEDDDERIKKNCIHFLELQKHHHAATFEIEECIAWLEKKGKQLTDKNKPRFNVGDWVVFIKSKSVYRVEKKENYEYTLRHILGGSMCLPFSNEKLIREWTIKDAKNGDVLATSSGPFIYNGMYEGSSCPGCYCGINTLGRFERCICETNWTNKKVYPATKEQRDALMKAMNYAGYKWNAETKTLEKLVKPKFDPKTLQPFDRVLVRLRKDCIWHATFFSHYDKEVKWGCYPFVTTGSRSYSECIPYNDETKHLLGTSEEAPEFYRYWED